MRNKKIKILFTILLLIFLIFCITNIAFATDASDKGNFDFTAFDSTSNASADEAAKHIMGTGIQTVKVVGYGISIVMLLYIGIKYMLAAPSEKADLKKSLVIFTVGAVLVFGATTVLDIIINFASSNGLAPSQATAVIIRKGE